MNCVERVLFLLAHYWKRTTPERRGCLSSNLAKLKSGVPSCKFQDDIEYSIRLGIEVCSPLSRFSRRLYSGAQPDRSAEDSCDASTSSITRVSRPGDRALYQASKVFLVLRELVIA